MEYPSRIRVQSVFHPWLNRFSFLLAPARLTLLSHPIRSIRFTAQRASL